jgi:GNAT superfamily N-acetyltransferase
MRRIIARRHPFFGHSDGEFFVATRGGRTVGRIAALEPKRFNEYQGKQDGRFYFFESEEDEAIARALFERAAEWALKRDLRTLVGPKGFSAFTGNGILIDGFDYRASMTMMPYHLPYYGSLMEACGFEKSQDFYSALLREGAQDLSARYRRAAEIARKRSGLEVPRIRSKRELKRVAAEVGRVYNESWEDHADFTPVTEAELQEMVDDLMVVTTPSLIRVFRAGDEVAGFVLAFPDISRAMRRAKGRLNPLSMLLLLLEKRRTSHYLVNGLGILPKYRKSGGLPLLFTEITDALREHGASTAEMTQIADTTDLMLSNIDKLGGEVYKTHRVYQKNLE